MGPPGKSEVSYWLDDFLWVLPTGLDRLCCHSLFLEAWVAVDFLLLPRSPMEI